VRDRLYRYNDAGVTVRRAGSGFDLGGVVDQTLSRPTPSVTTPTASDSPPR
jgi:hypothetical protein